MYNIIINASNLYVGGGLQVALSFINELKFMNSDLCFHVFVSLAINNQLRKNDFPNNFSFYVIERSPSSLKTRKMIIEKLDWLESEISPILVFTIFGPSYWRPRNIHIMGFADGWVLNPGTIAYKRLSCFSRIKRIFYNAYKAYHIKKEAEYYIVETEDARNKLARVHDIDSKKIYVVGNTYSSIFNEKCYLDHHNKYYISLPQKESEEFRFLYIAHNHPSKNIQVIKEVVPLIGNRKMKFVLTIDDKSYKKIFKNNNDFVINIGPIHPGSCPSVYKQCDAVFAPTLLETFSATYPEAMKMKKPILTSNYSFATDICGDAAMYFDPIDPSDIAEKILVLANNKDLRNKLIKKGEERLTIFETAESRARKYIEIFKKIIKEDIRYV